MRCHGGAPGSDFANELGKQKLKLSLNQKEEWQDWHTGKVQALEDLRGQIAVLDAVIDRQVYGLYGLSAAETARVEGGDFSDTRV